MNALLLVPLATGGNRWLTIGLFLAVVALTVCRLRARVRLHSVSASLKGLQQSTKSGTGCCST